MNKNQQAERADTSQAVTVEDIRAFGTCKIHHAWKLLCCHPNLVDRINGKWFWRGGKLF